MYLGNTESLSLRVDSFCKEAVASSFEVPELREAFCHCHRCHVSSSMGKRRAEEDLQPYTNAKHVAVSVSEGDCSRELEFKALMLLAG